jgi:hypothetical protein
MRAAAIVALAQTIQQEGAFDRLPILADTLQENGCHDTDIQNHCPQPDSHIRGCWVVFSILGNA